MRILIAAAGSRGDVAPYTGLGSALRAAGHDVALATTDAFAPLVRAAGLEYRALPGNPARGGGGGGDRRELMRAAAAFIGDLGQGFADAMADGADLLLLSTTTAPLGWHLAEATGTPSLGVYLQPTAPTGAFPPVVTGSRSLGRPGNRLAGRFALRMTDRLYAPAVTALRDRLGLPPASPSAARRRQDRADRPVLHGFSTALVPRPADWRPGLRVVGNWWPHHDVDAQLPAELEDFLSAGPAPVLIGFGSMASGGGGNGSASSPWRPCAAPGCAASSRPAARGSPPRATTCSPSGTYRTPCSSRAWPPWSTTPGPVPRPRPCAPVSRR